MNVPQTLQTRLKNGGWTCHRRNGKHSVWHHPNGSHFTLPETIKDVSHKRANYLKTIERLEREPEAPIPVAIPVAIPPPPRKELKVTAPATASAKGSLLVKAASPAPTAPRPVAFKDFFHQHRLDGMLSTRTLAELFQSGGLPAFNEATIRNTEAGTRKMTEPELEVFKSIFNLNEIPAHVKVELADPARREALQKAREAKAGPKDAQAPKVTPAGRTADLATAREILENPRLTDAEVAAMVADLKRTAVKILLGGLA